MHRMIAQILDVTRARLGDGIPVTPDKVSDISFVVAKIVEEMRAANPGRTIDLRVEGPCLVQIDGDRFEQVVSNLLGNAVAHGAPGKPIRVTVSPRENTASVSVHNEGTPIDPASLPTLFDPFQRGRPNRGSDGLGLGLYISENIVRAHGGEIRVESSADRGTQFEAIIPRQP
jgi:signal transduction histidine kinase